MTRGARALQSLRRNAIQAVPTMFVIITIGFFVMQLAPGDVVDYMAAETGAATQEGMAALRQRFGLDLPVLNQLIAYYLGLAHGSLGISARYGIPVADMVLSRIPGTLLLMGVSIVFAIAIGLLTGTVMALSAGRLPDRILSFLSLLFYSVPTFWIGLMLIILFSVYLGWLPSGGSKTIGGPSSGLAWLIDRISYITLPALTLGLHYLAIYTRLTRAAVLEASGRDYVRTAVAKGLSPGRVVRRHILRNALIPITTFAGVHIAGVLGGAVVVETIFSWPGMGRLAYEAIQAREYQVLLGIMLVSSLVVITCNALIDLLQALLDPRVEIR
ncbi:ABC transporter permease [Agrobacterium sp. 22-222-1]